MVGARFELGPIATVYDRIQLRVARVLIRGITGLGALLIAAGIGLALWDMPAIGALSVVILVALGCLILIVGSISYPKASQGVIRLEVLPTGVTVTRVDGRSFQLEWGNYRNKIIIVDSRAFPADRKARGLSSVEFVFNAQNVPAQGPLPKEAVLAILGSARTYGMKVEGWMDERLGPGPEVDVTILPA